MPETRKASSPSKGALRDAVRTFVALAIGFLAVKFLGAEGADKVVGATEGLVVIITSAILAFAGKALRTNTTSVLGKVI